jgi:acyl carrier protein
VNISAQVRELIRDNFLFRQGVDNLPDTDSLIETGVIDSAGVLTLVVVLEEKFGITVHDDEVTPENLDGIAKLTAYIERKLSVCAERS